MAALYVNQREKKTSPNDNLEPRVKSFLPQFHASLNIKAPIGWLEEIFSEEIIVAPASTPIPPQTAPSTAGEIPATTGAEMAETLAAPQAFATESTEVNKANKNANTIVPNQTTIDGAAVPHNSVMTANNSPTPNNPAGDPAKISFLHELEEAGVLQRNGSDYTLDLEYQNTQLTLNGKVLTQIEIIQLLPLFL